MSQPISMDAIGRGWVDAFNRRDAEGLVALADEAIEFHPSTLVGDRRVYRGHDGLRAWTRDLGGAVIKHTARVREVVELDARRFLILSQVLLDGELMSPSAMLGRITDEGKLVEARSYLSDDPMLAEIGLLALGRHGRPGATASEIEALKDSSASSVASTSPGDSVGRIL